MTHIICSLNWRGVFKNKIRDEKNKLTEHILRANSCDPMRQVSFRNDSAEPYTPIFRKLERRRKNWLMPSSGFCSTKRQTTPYTGANGQQEQFWIQFVRLVHASHCPCSDGYVSLFAKKMFEILRSYPIPFHQFLRVCLRFFLDCLPLVSLCLVFDFFGGAKRALVHGNVSWHLM